MLIDLISEKKVETGNRPMVAGMDKYRVASGLAFYRSRLAGEGGGDVRNQIIDETTGRNLFRKGSVMYSHWHQPDLFYQRNIVVVSSKLEELNPSVFNPYVRDIGPLKTIMIYQQGEEVGPVYYRYLRGYRGGQTEVTQK